MAIDNKYGRVTLERGDIGEDEPIFIFRAQDVLLLDVIDFYYNQCKRHGSPDRHLNKIEESRELIQDWQRDNHTQVPQSSGN